MATHSWRLLSATTRTVMCSSSCTGRAALPLPLFSTETNKLGPGERGYACAGGENRKFRASSPTGMAGRPIVMDAHRIPIATKASVQPASMRTMRIQSRLPLPTQTPPSPVTPPALPTTLPSKLLPVRDTADGSLSSQATDHRSPLVPRDRKAPGPKQGPAPHHVLAVGRAE